MNVTSILCSALTGASMLAGIAAPAQTQFTYKKITYPNYNFLTIALEVTDDGRVGGYITNEVDQTSFYVKSDGTYATYNGTDRVTAINGSTVYGWVDQSLGYSLDATGKETTLPGPSFQAVPNGVNKSGVVVGVTEEYQTSSSGFTLKNGTYSTYLVPGSDITSFSAINDQGVIVGTSNKTGGPLSSFMLRNGQQTTVAFPHAYSTVVTGINDAGEMVGWYLAVAQGAPRVFFYDGKSYSTLPTPPNSYACSGAGHINNFGQFVVQCGDPQNGGYPMSLLVTPAAR